MTDGHLNFDTKINTGGFTRGIDTITRSADKLKGLMVSLGGTIAAAFSAKEMIEAAAGVKALNAQFEQTFGGLQSQAQAAIATVAEQDDILATRLQGTATKIYAFAKTSGMDSASALGLMNEALQVTADSAAYYDRSLEDTAETLQSFLNGNYANDAALGLSATETTRNAAAMELYGKSFRELSEAQKQLTLLQMVKDANELSGAMGQAAREADGWENVTGNLKESWHQLLAAVGQPLLALAVPVVQRLTEMLSKLTSMAQSAAKALEQVFGLAGGDGGDSTGQMAEDAAQAADSYADMAENAEAAAEANEGSLASFDKINKLGEDSSRTDTAEGSSGNSFAEGGTAAFKVEVETDEAADKIAGFLRKVKSGFEQLRDTASTLFGLALGYVTDNFGKIFDNIYGGLTREAGELLDTFGHIWEDIKSLAEPLKDYFEDDYTPYMQQVFTTLGDIATGLFDTFNMVFRDIWDIAVFPLLDNLVRDGLPLVTRFGTECWKTLDTLFWDVKDLFDTAWTDFIAPLMTRLVTIWTDTVTLLREKWDKWGKPIFDGIREALDNTTANIKMFWQEWLKPIFDEAMAKADEIWSEHILPLLDNLLEFFGELATGWLDFYNGTLSPIIGWIIDKLAPTVSEVGKGIVDTIAGFVTLITDCFNGLITFLRGAFKGDLNQAWEGIKQIFSAYWTAIKDIFAPVASWFGERFTTAWGSVKSAFASVKTFFEGLWSDIKAPFETVATWFEEKFSAAWQKVKDVFSTGGDIFEGIKDGISGVFTDVVNHIIDGINTVISEPFNSINDALQVIRDFGLGDAKPFADIPSLSIPQIPRLATGTVVPANYGEFLAVLGDNKSAPEIVAPEPAIRQAVLEALAQYGGGAGAQRVQLIVPLYLDRREIGRAAVDDINARIRANGSSPIITA